MLFYRQKILLAILLVLCIGKAASALSIGANPFLYSAQYSDSESRLQYLDARYYAPAFQRFVSRDSYRLMNRYAYASGNPMTYADPSGHITTATWAQYLAPAIAGGIGGFGAVGAVGAMWKMLPELSGAQRWMIGINSISAVLGMAASGLNAYAGLTDNKDLAKVANYLAITQTMADAGVDGFGFYAASTMNSTGSMTAFTFAGVLNLSGATLSAASLGINNPSLGYSAFVVQNLAMLVHGGAMVNFQYSRSTITNMAARPPSLDTGTSQERLIVPTTSMSSPHTPRDQIRTRPQLTEMSSPISSSPNALPPDEIIHTPASSTHTTPHKSTQGAQYHSIQSLRGPRQLQFEWPDQKPS